MTSSPYPTPGRLCRLPHRRRRAAAFLTLPAVMIAACAEDGGAPAVTVRDSAGIRIVENVAADSASMAWLALEPDPRLIGAADGASGVELFQVRDARHFADGGIVVANGGSAELLFFGPDGEHVATGGRRGGGPGEFQQISSLLLLPGDSVLAFDVTASRASVFDRAGTFVREFTPSREQRLILLGRFADGSYLGSVTFNINPGELQNGLQRPETAYVRFREPGTGNGDDAEDGGAAVGSPALDTVATFPGTERILRMQQRGGEITSIELITPPLGRSTSVVVAGDVMVVALQDDPQIEVRDHRGRLLRLVRTGAPAVPVTPALREAWIEQRAAAAPPDRQPALRQLYADMEFPATVPPYGAILAGPDGEIWVQDFTGAGAPNVWTVYAPEGERRARLRLPERFRAMRFGENWVLGVERDELDVEQVRLYRFGPS